MSQKLQEAENLEKEAKKLSERSVFRWSPDWDGAASKYEKAAIAYKNLGKENKAVDCYVSAGYCHEKNKILYSAGRCYESAANIYQTSIKDFISALKNYKDAARVYSDDGKNDRAAEVLVKAAKAMEKEPGGLEQCFELFKEGIEMSCLNGKYHNTTDLLRQYNTMLIKYKRFDDAIKNCETQLIAYQNLNQADNLRKTMLSIIVLYLRNDDPVAAENALTRFTNESGAANFSNSDEGDLAVSFVSAFQNRDEKLLESTRQNSLLKYLEGPFAKIAMTLSLNPLFDTTPQVKKEKPKKISTPNAPGEGTAMANSKKNIASKKASLFAVDDDEEEDDGDNKKRSNRPTNTFLSTGSKASANKPKTAFQPLPSKEEMEELKRRQQEAYEERQRQRRNGELNEEDDEDLGDDDDDDDLELTGASKSKTPTASSSSSTNVKASSSTSTPTTTKTPTVPMQPTQPSHPSSQTNNEDEDDIQYVSTKHSEAIDEYFNDDNDYQKPPSTIKPRHEDDEDEDEDGGDVFDPNDLT
ncbi:hypothetical protein C9374_010380 [Naegleria lovaniensis]|uniref:Gamma-soluble NSF attachment protein n=1 Tax=Naegleria lovaniensis TaxID=51637 RepID=A0AA88KGL6_NAELO|nr:uncharacterized protein C9374_010380 [Naegleria lovaniensis]KAG2375006.1 hypothetical protein C9374_010380 [Naegleria lovaniensis]